MAVTDAGRAVTVWVQDRPGPAADRLYAHVREPGAVGWSDRMLLSGDEHVFNAGGRLTPEQQRHRGLAGVRWRPRCPGADPDAARRRAVERAVRGRRLPHPGWCRRPHRAQPRRDRATQGAGLAPAAGAVRPRAHGGRNVAPGRPAAAVGRNGATNAFAIDNQGQAHVLGRRAAQPRAELVHWLREPGSAGWERTVLGTIAGRRNVPYPALGSNPAGDLVVSWTRRNPADGHQPRRDSVLAAKGRSHHRDLPRPRRSRRQRRRSGGRPVPHQPPRRPQPGHRRLDHSV